MKIRIGKKYVWKPVQTFFAMIQIVGAIYLAWIFVSWLEVGAKNVESLPLSFWNFFLRF